MTAFLTERDLLIKTGWPCRQFVDSRMRHKGFPRPVRREHTIGDQWREDQVDEWFGLRSKSNATETLNQRFEAMGKAD